MSLADAFAHPFHALEELPANLALAEKAVVDRVAGTHFAVDQYAQEQAEKSAPLSDAQRQALDSAENDDIDQAAVETVDDVERTAEQTLAGAFSFGKKVLLWAAAGIGVALVVVLAVKLS